MLGEPGWIVRPEVSFNLRGERGSSISSRGTPSTRTLLVIEVKTEIVDVGEIFGTFDRKRRLGATIGRQLGLEPSHVSAALVVADTSHEPSAHRSSTQATFGAVLPHGGRRFRGFLQRPDPARSLRSRLLANRHPGHARHERARLRRVRTTARRPAGRGS